MGSNFVVARVAHHTRSSCKGIQVHNDRKSKKHKNPDIVQERSYMNVDLIPTRGKKLYTEVFDEMVEAGKISTAGLKADAYIFNEILHDVNSEYWLSYEEHGFKSPEEFAMAHFRDCLNFDKEKYGEDHIVSAEIHFDEINQPLTKKYGYPVYHYHMHVVAIPTVEKVKRWSKRCKDPELVGTVKERFQQVSNSKFWQSSYGQPNSYTLFQDEISDYLIKKYPDLQRGEKGSKAKNLAPEEFKQTKDELRELQAINDGLKKELEELKEERERLQRENEDLKEYNTSLENEVELALASKREQAAELADLRAGKKELVRELETLEKRAAALTEMKIEAPELDVKPPKNKVDFIVWCLDRLEGVLNAVYNYCTEKYREWQKSRQKPILDEAEAITKAAADLQPKFDPKAFLNDWNSGKIGIDDLERIQREKNRGQAKSQNHDKGNDEPTL